MNGSRCKTGESLTIVAITPRSTMSFDSFAASVRVSAIGRSFQSRTGVGCWVIGVGRWGPSPTPNTYHLSPPLADSRPDHLGGRERVEVRGTAHGAAGGD